ncbi:MAG: hypothetical protein U9R00_03640 [Patescibacteria group bacterium]|nr:hypothetical protein [Patescibacteria group bacterium]
MDINPQLKESIKEDFLLLPKEIQGALNNFKFAEIFVEIGTKHGLIEKEVKILELETILVLIGVVRPSQYESNLKDGIPISSKTAQSIQKDIYEKIFEPLADKVGGDKKTEVPLPPYKKEENPVATPPVDLPIAEDTKVMEESGIEIIKEKEEEKVELNKSNNNLLEKSGIEMMPDKKEEVKKDILPNKDDALYNIEHPSEIQSNIAEQKLNNPTSNSVNNDKYKEQI